MMSGCYLIGTKVLWRWRVLFTTTLHLCDISGLWTILNGKSRQSQLEGHSEYHFEMGPCVVGNILPALDWEGNNYLSGDSSISGEEIGTDDCATKQRGAKCDCQHQEHCWSPGRRVSVVVSVALVMNMRALLHCKKRRKKKKDFEKETSGPSQCPLGWMICIWQ